MAGHGDPASDATGTTGPSSTGDATGTTNARQTSGTTGKTGASGTRDASSATDARHTSGASGARHTSGETSETGASGTNGTSDATGTTEERHTGGTTGTTDARHTSSETSAGHTSGETGASDTSEATGTTEERHAGGTTGARHTHGTTEASDAGHTSGTTGASNATRTSVDEHAARVQKLLAPVLAATGVEIVALSDALGRLTSCPALSPVDLPLFRNAQMDGFAVRAADLTAVPVQLPVVGDQPAGDGEPAALLPGTARRIMTGAIVPDGADCVVPVEDTDATFGAGSEPDRVVTIRVPRAAGDYVRERGSDLHAGEVLVPERTRLAPRHLAALAAAGLERVEVRRRPRIAVITSGAELLPRAAPPAAGGTDTGTTRPAASVDTETTPPPTRPDTETTPPPASLGTEATPPAAGPDPETTPPPASLDPETTPPPASPDTETTPQAAGLDPETTPQAAGLDPEATPRGTGVDPEAPPRGTAGRVDGAGPAEGQRTPALGRIYDSNAVALVSAIRECGAEVLFAAQVGDHPDELVAVLDRAVAAGADAILTSGGISAGAFEVVREVMIRHRGWIGTVAMQPGGPQGLGSYRGVPVLSFPGNPVSTQISFVVFLRPILRAHAGLDPLPDRSGRLTRAVTSVAGKRQFLRGRLAREAPADTAGPGVLPEADAPARPGALSRTDAPTPPGALSRTDAPAGLGTLSGTDAPARPGALSGTGAPAPPDALSGTHAPAAPGTLPGVEPVSGPGSHLVAAMASAEVLLDIPAEITELPAGATVRVWEL